jgi:hypothetical protein
MFELRRVRSEASTEGVTARLRSVQPSCIS